MSMALSETPIREALVTTDQRWRRVRCFDELDSTNAYSLAEPVAWQVVTCRHQTSGRGRHARAWSSPPEASVALSLTVPMPAAPQRWGWLPLVTGLAVLDAMATLTAAPDRFALKWPNDVLAQEDSGAWGKICGILCELTTAGGKGGDPLVVAGIGLNVALGRAELPVPTATSLTLAGFPRPGGGDVVVAVARAFADRYDDWYDGSPERLRAAYGARCATLGREVLVHLPDETTVRGTAVDITAGGELVVETDAGTDAQGAPVRRAFAAGDVVHVRGSERSGMIGP